MKLKLTGVSLTHQVELHPFHLLDHNYVELHHNDGLCCISEILWSENTSQIYNK